MHGVELNSTWTTLLAGFLIAGAGVGHDEPADRLRSRSAWSSPRASGMASGINNTFRQVGIATGIASLGAIFQAGSSRRRTSLLTVVRHATVESRPDRPRHRDAAGRRRCRARQRDDRPRRPGCLHQRLQRDPAGRGVHRADRRVSAVPCLSAARTSHTARSPPRSPPPHSADQAYGRARAATAAERDGCAERRRQGSRRCAAHEALASDRDFRVRAQAGCAPPPVEAPTPIDPRDVALVQADHVLGRVEAESAGATRDPRE